MIVLGFAGPPVFIAVLVSWAVGIWVFGTIRRARRDWVGEKDIVGKLLFDERSVRLVSASETVVFQISDLAQLDINHNHIQGRSTGYRGPVMNGILTFELLTRHGSRTTAKGLIRNDEQHGTVHSTVLQWRSLGLAGKETFGPDRLMSHGLHVNARFSEINPPAISAKR